MKKVKIKYNKEELNLIIIALNEFRNKLIKENRNYNDVDELMLKIYNK